MQWWNEMVDAELTESEVETINSRIKGWIKSVEPIFNKVSENVRIDVYPVLNMPQDGQLGSSGLRIENEIQRIEIHLLMTRASWCKLEETVLHELAHALTDLKRYCKCKNGRERNALWKKMSKDGHDEMHDDYWGTNYAIIYRKMMLKASKD